MAGRLEVIFDEIPVTESFADIGCDHGYIVKMVSDAGKCGDITVSDISRESLKKAEKLLSGEIASGKVKAVCCDGLCGIGRNVKTVLIAGMGGEEIIRILSESDFLPGKLILQPMKNADKLRRFLFLKGYGITKDYMFCDGGKYYNLMTADFGEKAPAYSETEYEFGRGNLSCLSEDFLSYIKKRTEALERQRKLIRNGHDALEADRKLAVYREILNEN